MENTKREGFGSNFAFIMAAVGSAVGLGNIWGFPYKMGLNGGFAFLLIYLILAAFVGLAVMIGEHAIGRSTGMSPVAAYRKISKKFTWLGYLAVIAPFIILCFYMVLGGMVMRYACSYLTAMVGWDTWGVDDVSTFFGTFANNGVQMVLWTVIFIAINTIIVCGGVGGGIEKFCNIGMPCLFVILIIVIVYVACQDGAGGGWAFMFAWNIEPLKEDFLGVLKTAAGQMFFSLSLGMGAMITYGSYMRKQEKLQRNAVIVVCMDTLAALMAGMIVMPACYAFLDGNTSGGPGLLFNSMQIVFDSMDGFIGNLMGFLFYFLVWIAAISSSMSLLEAITATKMDADIAKGKAPKRRLTAIVFSVIILVFCLPTALDGIGSGISGGATMPTPAELLGMDYADAELDGNFEYEKADISDFSYSSARTYTFFEKVEGDFDANATYYTFDKDAAEDADRYVVAEGLTAFEDGVNYYTCTYEANSVFTREEVEGAFVYTLETSEDMDQSKNYYSRNAYYTADSAASLVAATDVFDASTTYYTRDAYFIEGEDGIKSAVDADAEFDANANYLVKTTKTWNGDWLDFYDVLSEGIIMPLGAMIMSVAIGWLWMPSWKNGGKCQNLVVSEVEASGHKMWGKTFFEICFKFITPIGMVIVLYGQITDFFGL